MNYFLTIVMILSPMFIGFLFRLPPQPLKWVNQSLNWVIYAILLLIGIDLAHVGDLVSHLKEIIGQTALLFVITMVSNLLVLCWFDRQFHWQRPPSARPQQHSSPEITGSLKQLACMGLGLVIGQFLPHHFLPPKNLGTYVLMLLIFLVGVQLRSNGISLRQVFLNKRGLQISVLFAVSCAVAGILFACLADIPMVQGLALSSGYGWYSLSGIVMTQAYGATWGSVALFNDLLRELFAFLCIPILMRAYPSTAVAIGGATSLDFTLPVLQASGGLTIVPLAISFGFVVNVLSPLLMVGFSALG